VKSVVLACVVEMVIPECRSSPYSTDDEWERLHDLAVIFRMKMPHVVPVYQIDGAFLAHLHQQVRILRARLIGKQHYATGTEIGVVLIQAELVPGREIIGHGERLVRSRPCQPKDTVSVIDPTIVGVEITVAG